MKQAAFLILVNLSLISAAQPSLPGASIAPTPNDSVFLYQDTTTGLFGLLDPGGRPITSAQYDEISPLSEEVTDYFKVLRGDGWGIVHQSGKETLAPDNYDITTGDFPTYFTITNPEGNLGVFHDGRMIIPAKYDEAIYYYLNYDSNGVASVGHLVVYERLSRKNTVLVLFDSEGKRLTPPGLDLRGMETSGWSGYFELRNKKKRGVFSAEYGTIIPAEYDYIEETFFDDSGPLFFIVKKKSAYGLFEGTGKQILPAKYKYIEPAYDDDTLFEAGDPENRVFQIMRDFTIKQVQEN